MDPDSAGCTFFHVMLEESTAELNPYSSSYLIIDVYGYCFYNDSFNATSQIPGKERPKVFDSQETLLMKTLAKQLNKKVGGKFNGAPCAYFDGIFDYFNIHEVNYHAKFSGQKWNGPCVLIYPKLG